MPAELSRHAGAKYYLRDGPMEVLSRGHGYLFHSIWTVSRSPHPIAARDQVAARQFVRKGRTEPSVGFMSNPVRGLSTRWYLGRWKRFLTQPTAPVHLNMRVFRPVNRADCHRCATEGHTFDEPGATDEEGIRQIDKALLVGSPESAVGSAKSLAETSVTLLVAFIERHTLHEDHR